MSQKSSVIFEPEGACDCPMCVLSRFTEEKGGEAEKSAFARLTVEMEDLYDFVWEVGKYGNGN